jgi:hypothetical protein
MVEFQMVQFLSLPSHFTIGSYKTSSLPRIVDDLPARSTIPSMDRKCHIMYTQSPVLPGSNVTYSIIDDAASLTCASQ